MFAGRQYNALSSGGMGNSDAFAQYSDTDPHEVDFYAFVPVNGDATFTALTENGTSVGATKLAYTYYEGIMYPGLFDNFTLATGAIIVYKFI